MSKYTITLAVTNVEGQKVAERRAHGVEVEDGALVLFRGVGTDGPTVIAVGFKEEAE